MPPWKNHFRYSDCHQQVRNKNIWGEMRIVPAVSYYTTCTSIWNNYIKKKIILPVGTQRCNNVVSRLIQRPRCPRRWINALSKLFHCFSVVGLLVVLYAILSVSDQDLNKLNGKRAFTAHPTRVKRGFWGSVGRFFAGIGRAVVCVATLFLACSTGGRAGPPPGNLLISSRMRIHLSHKF